MDEESDGSNSVIDGLDEFLDQNTHLLTSLGIFGAIAIYISTANVPSGPDTLPLDRTGQAVGFGIVLIVVLLITAKAARKIHQSEYRALSRRNLGLSVFTVFCALLAIQVGRYFFSFQRESAMAIGVVVLAFSHLFLPHLLRILQEWEVYDLVESHLGLGRTGFIYALGILTFLIFTITNWYLTQLFNTDLSTGYTDGFWTWEPQFIGYLILLFFSVPTLLFLLVMAALPVLIGLEKVVGAVREKIYLYE